MEPVWHNPYEAGGSKHEQALENRRRVERLKMEEEYFRSRSPSPPAVSPAPGALVPRRPAKKPALKGKKGKQTSRCSKKLPADHPQPNMPIEGFDVFQARCLASSGALGGADSARSGSSQGWSQCIGAYTASSGRVGGSSTRKSSPQSRALTLRKSSPRGSLSSRSQWAMTPHSQRGSTRTSSPVGSRPWKSTSSHPVIPHLGSTMKKKGKRSVKWRPYALNVRPVAPDHQLELIDEEGDVVPETLPSGLSEPVTAMVTTHGGVTVWAVDVDGNVCIFSSSKGELLKRFVSRRMQATAIFASGRWIWVGYRNGSVRVYDSISFRPVMERTLHHDQVTCFCRAYRVGLQEELDERFSGSKDEWTTGMTAEDRESVFSACQGGMIVQWKWSDREEAQGVSRRLVSGSWEGVPHGLEPKWGGVEQLSFGSGSLWMVVDAGAVIRMDLLDTAEDGNIVVVWEGMEGGGARSIVVKPRCGPSILDSEILTSVWSRKNDSAIVLTGGGQCDIFVGCGDGSVRVWKAWRKLVEIEEHQPIAQQPGQAGEWGSRPEGAMERVIFERLVGEWEYIGIMGQEHDDRHDAAVISLVGDNTGKFLFSVDSLGTMLVWQYCKEGGLNSNPGSAEWWQEKGIAAVDEMAGSKTAPGIRLLHRIRSAAFVETEMEEGYGEGSPPQQAILPFPCTLHMSTVNYGGSLWTSMPKPGKMGKWVVGSTSGGVANSKELTLQIMEQESRTVESRLEQWMGTLSALTSGRNGQERRIGEILDQEAKLQVLQSAYLSWWRWTIRKACHRRKALISTKLHQNTQAELMRSAYSMWLGWLTTGGRDCRKRPGHPGGRRAKERWGWTAASRLETANRVKATTGFFFRWKKWMERRVKLRMVLYPLSDTLEVNHEIALLRRYWGKWSLDFRYWAKGFRAQIEGVGVIQKMSLAGRECWGEFEEAPAGAVPENMLWTPEEVSLGADAFNCLLKFYRKRQQMRHLAELAESMEAAINRERISMAFRNFGYWARMRKESCYQEEGERKLDDIDLGEQEQLLVLAAWEAEIMDRASDRVEEEANRWRDLIAQLDQDAQFYYDEAAVANKLCNEGGESFEMMRYLHHTEEELEATMTQMQQLNADREDQEEYRRIILERLEAEARSEAEHKGVSPTGSSLLSDNEMANRVGEVMYILRSRVLKPDQAKKLYDEMKSKVKRVAASQFFLRAHEVVKRAVLSVTGSSSLVFGRKWPLNGEMARRIPRHLLSATLEAIRNLVISYEFLTQKEKDQMHTDEEVVANGWWLLEIADLACDERRRRNLSNKVAQDRHRIPGVGGPGPRHQHSLRSGSSYRSRSRNRSQTRSEPTASTPNSLPSPSPNAGGHSPNTGSGSGEYGFDPNIPPNDIAFDPNILMDDLEGGDGLPPYARGARSDERELDQGSYDSLGEEEPLSGHSKPQPYQHGAGDSYESLEEEPMSRGQPPEPYRGSVGNSDEKFSNPQSEFSPSSEHPSSPLTWSDSPLGPPSPLSPQPTD